MVLVVRNQFANAGKCERCERLGFNPWVRKIPWSRKWQPTPVFLPGESYGQRSLVGYSPWGRKELDMTVSVCVHPHVPAPARTRTRTRTHAQAHTHTLQVKVYRKIHCVNQSRELEQLHQFQTKAGFRARKVVRNKRGNAWWWRVSFPKGPNSPQCVCA